MKKRIRIVSAFLAALLAASLPGTAVIYASEAADNTMEEETEIIVETTEDDDTEDAFSIEGVTDDTETTSMEELTEETDENPDTTLTGDVYEITSEEEAEETAEEAAAEESEEEESASAAASVLSVDFSEATLLLGDINYYDETDDLCLTVGDTGMFGLDETSDLYDPYLYDPDGAELVSVVYESEDESILTVDEDGNYEAVGYGYVCLYVTAEYQDTYTEEEDGETYEETDEWTVDEWYYFMVGPDMSSVKLSKSSFTVYWSEDCYMDTSVTVTIKSDYVFDSDDEMTELSVDSSNSKVYGYYTLSDNVLTFDLYGSGKTTLTITLNGKTFTISVRVRKVYCSTDSVLLSPGKTKTVSVKGAASTTSIKWSSSNKKVATVSSSGKIKAKKVGNAVITAKVGGKVKVGCVVSVTTAKKVKVVKKGIKIAKTCTYSQAKRMKSGYYDCSSLVWKAYKTYGYYFGSKSYAPTAANLAKYLKKKGKLKGSYTYKKTQKMVMRAGDLVFETGANNGRYKGIYHVEMFAGYALSYYNSSGTAVVTTTWASRSDGYADSGDLYGRP